MANGYQQSPAIPAVEREQMILDHLPQVKFIASRIHEKLPQHVPMDDLVSAGILGLIAAIDNFDPYRNVKLRTYAEHKIRGHILNSINKLEGTPRSRNRMQRDMQHAIAAAEQRLGQVPDSEAIAQEMGLSIDEYYALLSEMQTVSLGVMESLDTGDDEGNTGMVRYLADPKAESPARIVERDELKALLVEALKTIPEMERVVLNFYYLEGLNLREIAEIVDLHLTRVSQIKTQAILRLRSRMEVLWPGKVEL